MKMGTRVNYCLAADIYDEDSQVCAILYSNNSCANYDPEQRFIELAKNSTSVTSLISKLLNEKYPENAGYNIKGHCPFSLDSIAGDNEKVIFAYWESCEGLVKRGYTEASDVIITELPAMTPPVMSEIKKLII